jgi:hypothetical protein
VNKQKKLGIRLLIIGAVMIAMKIVVPVLGLALGVYQMFSTGEEPSSFRPLFDAVASIAPTIGLLLLMIGSIQMYRFYKDSSVKYVYLIAGVILLLILSYISLVFIVTL